MVSAAMAGGLLMTPLMAMAQPALTGDPAAAQVEEAAQAWLARYVADHALNDAQASATVSTPRRPASTCGEPYDIAVTDTKVLTRMRFSVRCPGESRATVYVVRARIELPVLVAATALAPNQSLSETDFTHDVRDFAHTPDALTDAAAAIGRTPRRAVKAGQVIQARLLKGVEAIRRGQAVQIVANTGPVEVTVPGTAMQNGAIDDVIRVKNTSTGKTISARVTSASTVEPVGAKK
nr:flagellar basal body P-ring formation chaperone FlgA [Ralstonia insidiosa]